MSNPIYDIPMSEPGGVPGAGHAAPPPTAAPFHSPPPSLAPDESPVSGAGQGTPSAAPAASPAAPETAFDAPPPMPSATFDMSGFPPPAAATAQPAFDAEPRSPQHQTPFDAPLEAPVFDASRFEVPAYEPPAAGPVLDLDAVPDLSTPFDFGSASQADLFEEPAAPAPLLDLDAGLDAQPTMPARSSRSHAPVEEEKDGFTVISPDMLEYIASLNPGSGIPDRDIVAALQQVIHRGASDLHVASGAPPLLRVDGGLSAIPGAEVWDRDKVRSALYSLMTPQGQAKFEEELELDFAYTLDESARFRVNFYQDRGAMGSALRIIPTRIKTLKELGISPEVGHFSTLPRGLVLVTGPTGSGKSTTLAALIDLVNETRRDHVVTVEDPIEFMHRNKRSLINQREVGRDTHSFNNALKHVLRQDPDVILIGELRDLETISVALTAAETGHLVFATLHTQSAPTTIDRVIDVFPPHQQDQVRTQLAATLKGVVCQTLVKKASGEGRSVATEVMFTTPAIANLVREGKTYQITSMLQSGSASGMHTMDQALAELVNEGTITKSAALEKSQDSETLERLITRVDMNGAELSFVSYENRFDAHASEGRRS